MVMINHDTDQEQEFESDEFEAFEEFADNDEEPSTEEPEVWYKKTPFRIGAIIVSILLVFFIAIMLNPTKEKEQPVEEPETEEVTELPEEIEETPETYTYQVPSAKMTVDNPEGSFAAAIQLAGDNEADDEVRAKIYNAVTEQFDHIKQGVQTGGSVDLSITDRTVVDRIASLYSAGFDLIPESFLVYETNMENKTNFVYALKHDKETATFLGEYDHTTNGFLMKALIRE